MASIKKIEKGKYQAAISLGRDGNGKQIRKWVTADSLGEIKKAARKIEEEYEHSIGTAYTNMNFNNWCEMWLKLNKGRLSPSTYVSYEIYFNRHYEPFFKNAKLSKITELNIKSYIADKIDEELSTTTIRKHFYVLNKILQEALKDKNPCRNIEAPKTEHYEHKVVTDDEFKKIRDFYKGTEKEIIVLLGALCGLRRGEIFALKPEDIDSENNMIRVNKALTINETHMYEEKGTKSKNGYRNVAAPLFLIEMLKTHKRKNKTMKGRLFTTRPDGFSSTFAENMRKIKLDGIRFHDLRHYHATWLYKNNVPDLVAAQRLGDDIGTIKKVYQHLDETLIKETNKAIINKMISM